MRDAKSLLLIGTTLLTLMQGTRSLQAATSQEMLEQLRATIKNDLEAASASVPTAGSSPSKTLADAEQHAKAFRLRSKLARLQTATIGSRELEPALQEIVRTQDSTAAAVQQAGDLLRQVQKERDDQIATLTKGEADLTAKAHDAVVNARSAKDLDPIVAEITILRDKFSDAGRTSDNSTIYSPLARLTRMIRAAGHWQDYLTAYASGKWSNASNSLTSFENSDSDEQHVLVAHSEVIARADAIRQAEAASHPMPTPTPSPDDQRAKAQAIINNIKDPSQIASALAALAESRTRNYGDGYDVQALSELGGIYQQLLSGMTVTPSAILRQSYGQTTAVNVLGRLRAQLIAMALPRALRLPADIALKPDESAPDFLARIIKDAQTKRDWPLLSRVAEVQAQFSGNLMESRTDLANLGAVQALVIASNREAAAEFSLATAAYLDALDDTSGLVPVDAVREKLEALKRDHPNDYAEALKKYRPSPAGVPSVFRGE